jgi:hypothetical protein
VIDLLLVLPSIVVVSSCDVYFISVVGHCRAIQLLQSHDALLAPLSWQSSCYSALMFIFLMFFKVLLLSVFSLMFLLLVVFILPLLTFAFV